MRWAKQAYKADGRLGKILEILPVAGEVVTHYDNGVEPIQYNKADLLEQGIPLLPIDLLEKDLNSQLKRPSFKASALKGTNVVTTLKKIISMTVASIKRDLK